MNDDYLIMDVDGADNVDKANDMLDLVGMSVNLCFFSTMISAQDAALKIEGGLDMPLDLSAYDDLITEAENAAKRSALISGRSWNDEGTMSHYVLANLEAVRPAFLAHVAMQQRKHGGSFTIRELISINDDGGSEDHVQSWHDCLLFQMFDDAYIDCLASPGVLHEIMVAEEDLRRSFDAFEAEERSSAKTDADVTYLAISFLRKEDGHLLTIHNQFMNNLAAVSSKKNVVLSSGVRMEAPGVRVFLDDMKATFGVSEHKLLVAAVNIFLQQNHTGNKWRIQDLRMTMPTDQLAELCGVALPDPTDAATPEGAAKLKRARQKKVSKFVETMGPHLQNLSESHFTWEENGKKYRTINILGAAEMTTRVTVIEFTLTFAEYLINKSLTQYPEALLKLDGRDQAAYVLGVNIFDHMNMYSNVKAGTANRLKVATLLRYASNQIPSIEEVRSGPSKRSYHDRIQDPLESALWKLVDVGALHDWYYCGKKGKLIADEDFMKTMIYEDWEKLQITFIPEKPIDHSRRIKELDAAKPTTKKKRCRPRKRLDAPAGS